MESLRVSGELPSLQLIRDFVTSTAANAGFDRRRVYRLTLAVDEIASNIIIHGYNEAGLAGEILIHAELTEDRLQITIEDAGKPYNPLSHQAPMDLESQLEDRAIGGLGIFLALNNVDEFQYKYADGSNHNILILNHSPTDSVLTTPES